MGLVTWVTPRLPQNISTSLSKPLFPMQCVETVPNSPGVIETGPLRHRQRVTNESISLTAQRPGGPPDHDYPCITDECLWIVNAICHHIWVYIQTEVHTCWLLWQIKEVSHHMSRLYHFLHLPRDSHVCTLNICMFQNVTNIWMIYQPPSPTHVCTCILRSQ